MKYKELLNFEPITEVVKFSRTSESDYQKTLVKTFVFSDTFKKHLIPLMIRNLDFNYSRESFGLQVVGNYGKGRSHLISLTSLIAQDAPLLEMDTAQLSKIEKDSGNSNGNRYQSLPKYSKPVAMN